VGVTVHPGDIVFGDTDDVLIIPNDVAEGVVRMALERVRGENRVREALKGRENRPRVTLGSCGQTHFKRFKEVTDCSQRCSRPHVTYTEDSAFKLP